MSTSPLGPEDIRAAAEVHRELGPEYSDEVVAAFLDKVDREVAARVQARLADTAGTQATRRTNRQSLAKGVAIGLCAGGLIGLAGVIQVSHTASPAPGSGFQGKRVEQAIPNWVPRGNFKGRPAPGQHRAIVVRPKSA